MARYHNKCSIVLPTRYHMFLSLCVSKHVKKCSTFDNLLVGSGLEEMVLALCKEILGCVNGNFFLLIFSKN